jgi:hypothetical protein
MKSFGHEKIEVALILLGERLVLNGSDSVRLVVCGGAALIVCSLVSRQTTRDVDIVDMVRSLTHQTDKAHGFSDPFRHPGVAYTSVFLEETEKWIVGVLGEQQPTRTKGQQGNRVSVCRSFRRGTYSTPHQTPTFADEFAATYLYK